MRSFSNQWFDTRFGAVAVSNPSQHITGVFEITGPQMVFGIVTEKLGALSYGMTSKFLM